MRGHFRLSTAWHRKELLKHQLHLRMLECGSKRGVDLAAALKPELQKHGLLHKLLAFVKDGGRNLIIRPVLLRLPALHGKFWESRLLKLRMNGYLVSRGISLCC